MGKLMTCLDAQLGQIFCDKNGVVDWCIVLVEMPLTRFEECCSLTTESLCELPLKSQHSYPLANQLWSIDFLTPPTHLIIPHRLPVFLESLMPLKNSCLIHAWCSKSSLAHSIRFYCIILSKFKTILLHSVLLKCQIAFLKFTSSDNQALAGWIPNCFCSCSFEAEIIKIGQ